MNSIYSYSVLFLEKRWGYCGPLIILEEIEKVALVPFIQGEDTVIPTQKNVLACVCVYLHVLLFVYVHV